MNVPHTQSCAVIDGAYASHGVHTPMRCADATGVCIAIVMWAVPLHHHLDLLIAHVGDMAVEQLAAMGACHMNASMWYVYRRTGGQYMCVCGDLSYTHVMQ